jgi:hypothetical protein
MRFRLAPNRPTYLLWHLKVLEENAAVNAVHG